MMNNGVIMTSKMIWQPWLLLTLLLTSFMTMAQQEENPYEVLAGVAAKTFERIKAEQNLVKQDSKHLETIVEEELLPYVDYKFSALKVLGKYYKKVPQSKMPAYIEVFREYLIGTYATALAQYEDQEVEFEPAKSFKGKKSATIRAVIKDPNRPDIKVALKVRKNSKTKQWRAYDLVAEGISLLDSKRSELEPLLRQGGIDAVIAALQGKTGKNK